MVKMLNNVDLADPAQASSAIDVVNGLVGGIEIKPEFSNIYDTTTSTTTSNELTRLLETLISNSGMAEAGGGHGGVRPLCPPPQILAE